MVSFCENLQIFSIDTVDRVRPRKIGKNECDPAFLGLLIYKDVVGRVEKSVSQGSRQYYGISCEVSASVSKLRLKNCLKFLKYLMF